MEAGDYLTVVPQAGCHTGEEFRVENFCLRLLSTQSYACPGACCSHSNSQAKLDHGKNTIPPHLSQLCSLQLVHQLWC